MTRECNHEVTLPTLVNVPFALGNSTGAVVHLKVHGKQCNRCRKKTYNELDLQIALARAMEAFPAVPHVHKCTYCDRMWVNEEENPGQIHGLKDMMNELLQYKENKDGEENGSNTAETREDR